METILVIDDEKDLVMIIKYALEANGYNEIGRASCRERV